MINERPHAERSLLACPSKPPVNQSITVVSFFHQDFINPAVYCFVEGPEWKMFFSLFLCLEPLVRRILHCWLHKIYFSEPQRDSHSGWNSNTHSVVRNYHHLQFLIMSLLCSQQPSSQQQLLSAPQLWPAVPNPSISHDELLAVGARRCYDQSACLKYIHRVCRQLFAKLFDIWRCKPAYVTFPSSVCLQHQAAGGPGPAGAGGSGEGTVDQMTCHHYFSVSVMQCNVFYGRVSLLVLPCVGTQTLNITEAAVGLRVFSVPHADPQPATVPSTTEHDTRPLTNVLALVFNLNIAETSLNKRFLSHLSCVWQKNSHSDAGCPGRSASTTLKEDFKFFRARQVNWYRCYLCVFRGVGMWPWNHQQLTTVTKFIFVLMF